MGSGPADSASLNIRPSTILGLADDAVDRRVPAVIVGAAEEGLEDVAADEPVDVLALPSMLTSE